MLLQLIISCLCVVCSNVRDKERRNALMLAAANGSASIMRRLLARRGMRVEARDVLFLSALTLAASEGKGGEKNRYVLL